jgi:hypothetical protein
MIQMYFEIGEASKTLIFIHQKVQELDFDYARL